MRLGGQNAGLTASAQPSYLWHLPMISLLVCIYPMMTLHYQHRCLQRGQDSGWRGSMVDIMFEHAFKQMSMSENSWKYVDYPIVRFTGNTMKPIGLVRLLITIREEESSRCLEADFLRLIEEISLLEGDSKRTIRDDRIRGVGANRKFMLELGSRVPMNFLAMVSWSKENQIRKQFESGDLQYFHATIDALRMANFHPSRSRVLTPKVTATKAPISSLNTKHIVFTSKVSVDAPFQDNQEEEVFENDTMRSRVVIQFRTHLRTASTCFIGPQVNDFLTLSSRGSSSVPKLISVVSSIMELGELIVPSHWNRHLIPLDFDLDSDPADEASASTMEKDRNQVLGRY
ncbi:hypothetical protein Cgig2_001618 [Carnegiea gigantea]|uniref:Uncharacterized protein n=1 Tax=Carnegiea gigantea TaxID=171969 RepID=A0A9Q1GRR7_9CARY|nr:hypothetical protein Cgig2_001618 [Carnegiea gigantea]